MDGPDINSPFAQALIREGQARGYSPFDISSAIGNAFTENGLKTSGIPGDNGTAFGGMQWRKDRYDALKAEAQKQGRDWTDPNVQASHWYNEQDAAGNKGAEDITSGNDMAINSLRPAGYKQGQMNDGVMGYQQRLAASKAAYSQLTGQPSPDGDLPAEGAQNASSTPSGNAGFQVPGSEGGVLAQSQQPQYEPTMGDKLNALSAAFFRRDSPQAAAQIDNALQQKINGQRAELKARQASENWKTGAAYQAQDGSWKQQQTSPDGRVRTIPVSESDVPKPDADAPPTRQEVQAQTGQNTAYQQYHQIENVKDAVDKLRDGLAKGQIQLGPDMQVKMLAQNLTGNSEENARAMKSMESNMIAAATVVAQAQKGAMTNFKFMKDLEQVMPSFAKFDNKAALESLTRVTDGMRQTMNGLSNTAINAGKSFPRLQTIMDPNTGEQVSVNDYFRDKTKAQGESETARMKAAEEFMKTPGRSAASGAPKVGFTKNGYRFNGGDPSNQANWQKE